MVKVKLEVKLDKALTLLYTKMEGKNFPLEVGIEDWYAQSYWVLPTNVFGNNVVAGVWDICYSNTEAQKGDRIPMGYDTQGVSGVTSAEMRLSVDGIVRHHVVFDNMLKDFAYYTIEGHKGEPTYLETLDKFDQWTKAQYDPIQKGDSKVPFI